MQLTTGKGSMRINLRSALLLTVLFLSAFMTRPAAAQSTISAAQELVLVGIRDGHWKCNTYTTIYQYLVLAANAPCPQKLTYLIAARDCACALSREIDHRVGSPTINQPFQTLGANVYDLAGFWHTIPDQVYGRLLCDLLSAIILITCL